MAVMGHFNICAAKTEPRLVAGSGLSKDAEVAIERSLELVREDEAGTALGRDDQVGGCFKAESAVVRLVGENMVPTGNGQMTNREPILNLRIALADDDLLDIGDDAAEDKPALAVGESSNMANEAIEDFEHVFLLGRIIS